MDGTKIIALLGGASALLCATGMGLAASAAAKDAAPQFQMASASVGAVQGSFASRALGVHNAERVRLGLPKLKWNVKLEREAAAWAQNLARRGVLQHADQNTRNATGENLWMGTTGGWQVERMVGMFIDEKRHYRHAPLPNISRTGNWADVGHYSQIVWRNTQEVGCALATGRGNDVLVCRYWPAGNVWGERAY